MKWEQFKNSFRKDAQQHEVDVDMTAIWDAIEPEVDALNKEEPRRRRFVFWILFAGLLTAGASWFAISQKANLNEKTARSEADQTTPVNEHHEVASETKLNSIVTPENNDKLETKANEKQLDVKLNSNDKESNPKANRNNSVNHENRTAYLDEKTKAKEQDSRTEQISTDSDVKLNPNIPSTKVGESKTLNASNLEKENSKAIENADSDKVLNIEERAVKSKEFVLESTDEFENLKIENGLQRLPNRMPLALEGKLSVFEGIARMASEKQNHKYFDFQKTSADGNGSNDLKYLVKVSGGVSIINRSLKAKNGSESILLQNRKKYETPLEASHYGISIGAEHHSGIRLFVGVQSTSIAERFEFNETQVVEDSVFGIKSYLLNFMGDSIPVMGMIPRISTTMNEIKIYNTYKLIDIPVTVAYHHSFNEKWNVGFEASVFANVSLKTEGSIPNEIAQEVNIKTSQRNIFKSKVGLNYALGLSVERSFSNRMALNFSPTVRFFPKDFSVDNYELSQKYVLIGANLGLSYCF